MLNDTLLRLLEVSIATSFLILPLCLASRKINRRYGAKWKYYIWLLLAVRLMIPVNLPAVNGFSILPDLSQRQQIQTQEQLIQSQAHTGSQPETVPSQSQEQEQEQSVSEPPYSIDGTEEIMDAHPTAALNVSDIAAMISRQLCGALDFVFFRPISFVCTMPSGAGFLWTEGNVKTTISTSLLSGQEIQSDCVGQCL